MEPGHRDKAEPVQRPCPIDTGRLVKRPGNGLESGQEHDGCKRKLLPDRAQDDGEFRPVRTQEPGDGLFDHADTQKDGVQNAELDVEDPDPGQCGHHIGNSPGNNGQTPKQSPAAELIVQKERNAERDRVETGHRADGVDPVEEQGMPEFRGFRDGPIVGQAAEGRPGRCHIGQVVGAQADDDGLKHGIKEDGPNRDERGEKEDVGEEVDPQPSLRTRPQGPTG